LKQHERTTLLAQDQLATAQAKLEQAVDEFHEMRDKVKYLQGHVQDHAQGAQEAEEEVEELHQEYQQLEAALKKQEKDAKKWKTKAQDLIQEVEKLRGLKVSGRTNERTNE
jgi:chromosome segregation ATPase